MTIKSYFANKKTQPNNGSPPLKYKREKPWYYLTKEESIAINSKNKRVSHLTKEEYQQAYIKHKLKKWELKHRKPCKDNDLFAKEFIPVWEEQRKKALESFKKKRNEKVRFVMRYRLPNDDFVEKEVKVVKNKTDDLDAFDIYKPSHLKKELKKMVKRRANDSTFVCGKLYANNHLLYITTNAETKKKAA